MSILSRVNSKASLMRNPLSSSNTTSACSRYSEKMRGFHFKNASTCVMLNVAMIFFSVFIGGVRRTSWS